MSDLAGFLLARIAEDEAGYKREAAGIEWLTVNGRELWDHLLAECEAKRRIVEEAFIVQAGSTEVVYIAPNGRQGRRRALYPSALAMLKALAAVYADHPDFDPAWRFTSPGDDDGRWDDDGGRHTGKAQT